MGFYQENDAMRNSVKTNRYSFITVVSVCFPLLAFVFPAHVYAAGEIWVWGNNTYGECNVPEPNTDFTAIAGGSWHSLGLKADGSIVAWGDNEQGQCNVPEPNTGFTAIAAGGFFSIGLKQDGSIVAWGYNGDGECNLPSPNTGFTAIAAGEYHSLGLKTDGSIVAWGWNGLGQCNVPEPNTGFTAIAASNHSLGLKEDGSIVAWGFNVYGQCNVPEPNTGFTAIGAGGRHSIGLKTDGSIVAWGQNTYGECNLPSPNTDFTAIATGSGAAHSIGLKTNGSIVAWGYNVQGQCNVPEPNTGFTAIAVSGEHSLGIKELELNITIARCTVTAGKTQGQDAFSASGTVEFPAGLDLNNVKQIDVGIISLADGAPIYAETIGSSIAKGKFKYTHKGAGAITSLVVDSNKKLFSINAQKVDLTGLSCPLRLDLTMSGPITGNHKLSGEANEAIVNGTKKLIPTRLMRTYDNTFVVNKAKASSSSLSVTGDIAVVDTSVDLSSMDVNFSWGTQTFSVPPGSFKAKGHVFKCSKVAADANGKTGVVTAQVDTDKATFTLSVKGASAIDTASASIPFGIRFADFNEIVDVDRVTGRSW